MCEISKIPLRVRHLLESNLLQIIELDEWLKRFWWDWRYREKILAQREIAVSQVRAFLQFFKTAAARHRLNGTQIIRALYRELRARRPPVRVLTRDQVARLYCF